MIAYFCLYTTQMMQQFARTIDWLYGLQKNNIDALRDHDKQLVANGIAKMLQDEINRLALGNDLGTKVWMLRTQMVPNNYVSTVAITREVELLQHDVISELARTTFAYIPSPNNKYFEQEHLFGEAVNLKIPAAVQDVKDAGNCIAASVDTAAVFHLMRVAEHGLRALAKKLRVSVKHKGKPYPLELGDWEQVITEIKNKITAIRLLPKASKQRQGKLELYSDAADHCAFMKDIWRNNTSHTRKPYKQSEAIAILDRVRDFMQFLGRIL
jgi:hypothetical protein